MQEKNTEQGKTESFVLLGAEFWRKFSAGQQWGPPADTDPGSSSQRGPPGPVFWKSPVGSTTGGGLILTKCKSSLWFEFSLLQTEGSSHGTPPSPGDGEWEMTAGVALQPALAEGLLSGNPDSLVSSATELRAAGEGLDGQRLHSSVLQLYQEAHTLPEGSVGTKSCGCNSACPAGKGDGNPGFPKMLPSVHTLPWCWSRGPGSTNVCSSCNRYFWRYFFKRWSWSQDKAPTDQHSYGPSRAGTRTMILPPYACAGSGLLACEEPKVMVEGSPHFFIGI